MLASAPLASGLVPWKVTYAAVDPEAAADFCVRYLGARAVPQPLPGGNGTCALIKWVTFDAVPNYEFHFVNSFDARVSTNFTLADWANYMETLNGNLSALDTGGAPYNQYMDNHVRIQIQRELTCSRLP